MPLPDRRRFWPATGQRRERCSVVRYVQSWINGVRTRVGTESSQLGGDEQAWEDGLYPRSGGSGHVSRDDANAEKQSRGSTSSQHYDRDDSIEKKTWFKSIEDESACKDGVCPVPWAIDVSPSSALQEDSVNHPTHYVIDGGIECIEAIEAALTNEEFRGYCKGNCIKYIWREKNKGNTESLKKAQWYLNRLIKLDESQNG